MRYCLNCGAPLNDGDKFCGECGRAIGVKKNLDGSNADRSKRIQEFAGKIIKCPNCGEVLNSLQIVCPSCGLDIRNVEATTSVQILSNELKAMERGESDDYTVKNFLHRLQKNSKEESAEKIANHIRNYAVPNTKEDILEFIILAASNIKIDSIEKYVPEWSDEYKYENIISNAWIGKLKQIYEKSRVMLKGDPVFEEIEKIYTSKEEEIIEAKRKNRLKCIMCYTAIAAIFVLIFGILGFMVFSDSKQEKQEPLAEENEYREEIVEEIDGYIKEGDYELALDAANDLEFEIPDHKKWAESYYEDMQQKWEKKQKKIIRKIKAKMKEGE